MVSILRKQSKLALTIIVILLVLVGVSQYLLSQKENTTYPVKRENVTFQVEDSERELLLKATVVIRIYFDKGNIIEGKVEAKTVYEALQRFTSEKELTFEVEQEKYGLKVISIGDKANSSSAHWEYIVNEKKGVLPVDRVSLQPGDSVMFKFGSIL